MSFSFIRAKHFTAFAVVFLLVSCSKSNTGGNSGAVSSASVNYSAVTTRGPENQLIVTVHSDKVAAPGSQLSLNMDLALVEEEGYQVAADRFTQMDLTRRSAQGRLGELFGAKALNLDTTAIAVGLPLAIQRSTERVAQFYPETMLLLEHFAKGVNRYLDDVEKATPMHSLLLQYRTVFTKDANYTFQRWTPADSISVGTAVAFYLSSNIYEKTSLGVIAEIMFATGQGEKFTRFLDTRPLETNTILGGTKAVADVPAAPGPADRRRAPKMRNALFDWLRLTSMTDCKGLGFPFPSCDKPLGVGSNNWVVSKKFAGGDETLLWNDPHLFLTEKLPFYEAKLDSKSAGGTFRVRGFKPPGIPGILIGMNDDIAWGFTNLGADVDDVYLEEIDPDTNTYKIKGEKHELKTIEHEYVWRAADNRTVLRKKLPLRIAPKHGPIFSDFQNEAKAVVEGIESIGLKGAHVALSYKWVGHRGTTESVAMLNANRAKSYEEYRQAVQDFEVGAQNMVVADKNGNIGYYAHGKFPERPYLAAEHYPPYMFVMHDIDNAREWEEEFRKEIPEKYTDEGYIVTANNDPYGMNQNPDISDYKNYLAYNFHDGVRAKRIEQLIVEKKQKNGKLTAKDMMDIGLDHKDVMAERMIALLERVPATALKADAQALRDRLLAWKAAGAEADRDSYDVGQFYEWATLYMEDHFSYVSSRMGAAAVPDYDEKLKQAWNTAVKKLFKTPVAITTLYHKTKDALDAGKGADYDATIARFVRTLDTAVVNIAKKDLTTTRWGSLNRLTFHDGLEGLVPSIFSLPLERSGAWETVDPAAPGLGAAMRMVVSLKKDQPIQAWVTTPGANYDTSESPESKNKVVQSLRDWRDGRFRQLVN